MLKKFGISRAELDSIISAPNHLHTDYPNQSRFIEGLSGLRTYIRRRAKSI